MFYAALCRDCGKCIQECPARALRVNAEGRLVRNSACTACGHCASICRHKAHALSGNVVSVAEVCASVAEHWRIFQQSGGGVTCSGGEPLAQQTFLRALLSELHEEMGFHTCIETSGFAPWSSLQNLLPLLDLIFLDLKHMDDKLHKIATGQSNKLILENTIRLAEAFTPIIVRIPLIPGYNDTDDNAHALGTFLQSTGLRQVEVIPQHIYGKSKYAALDRRYDVDELSPNVEGFVETLLPYGLEIETRLT